jgi:hypothetical protein
MIDNEPWGGEADKRHSPSAARNREPILAVLRRVLPATGVVLEIASGAGEHAVHFAAALPRVAWQPTDPDPDSRRSIAAWRAEAALPNLREPLALDVTQPDWPLARADAVVCINMIHISPWSATLALFAGAARLLPPNAPLFLYGPFRQPSVPTAPSNEAFDASLRDRNPEWGLRDLAEVTAVAQTRGFTAAEVVEMPANNLSVIYRRND